MTKTVPEKAAVVVIGGGVIGTSIAFHLAESGVHDVVLLEKDELGSGSTCRAAGGVRATFSNASNIAIGLRGLDVYQFAVSQGHGDLRPDLPTDLLSGADLRTSTIERMRVGITELHGAIVDPFQASYLAGLMGLVIKNDGE